MSGQMRGDAASITARQAKRLDFVTHIFSFFDLTNSRSCITLFLLLAVPTLMTLSILMAPFQGLDESSQFYRAVQISEGRILPIKSPARTAAGDYLETSLHRLGGYYYYLSFNNWHRQFGEGPQDRSAAWATGLTGQREFVPFSNTVIYFPLAYAAPASVIAVMRAIHTPPLSWLYAARLADDVIAIGIFCLALGYFPSGRTFVFVLALLPRTLFGTAALSADSLLIPFASLFAALVSHLSEEGQLSTWQYTLLIVSTFFVCVNKIAYIPLVAISPAIALMSIRRDTKPFVVLCLSSIGTLFVWLVWTTGISSYVFPIRHDVHVDVYLQLRHIVLRPAHGVSVLMSSLLKDGFGYADTLVGGQLGSAQARYPRLLGEISYLIMFLTSIIAMGQVRFSAAKFGFTLLVVSGAATAVFLLLYMQYTGLDNPVVDGIQGRYFIPLLSILVAFLPKAKLPAPLIKASSIVVISWMLLTSVETINLMKARYWQSTPVAGERFGDPHIYKSE